MPICTVRAKPANTPEPKPMNARLAGWLALSAFVVGVDQLTKYLITQWLSYGQSWSVTWFFDLVLVYNPGAAFSFLADHDGWQRWFFIVLTSTVSIWLIMLMRKHVAEVVLPLGLALILGGAIGNAPAAMRADVLAHGGSALRYVQCPQAPFLDSDEQRVCEGK